MTTNISRTWICASASLLALASSPALWAKVQDTCEPLDVCGTLTQGGATPDGLARAYIAFATAGDSAGLSRLSDGTWTPGEDGLAGVPAANLTYAIEYSAATSYGASIEIRNSAQPGSVQTVDMWRKAVRFGFSRWFLTR